MYTINYSLKNNCLCCYWNLQFLLSWQFISPPWQLVLTLPNVNTHHSSAFTFLYKSKCCHLVPNLPAMQLRPQLVFITLTLNFQWNTRAASNPLLRLTVSLSQSAQPWHLRIIWLFPFLHPTSISVISSSKMLPPFLSTPFLLSNFYITAT